MGGMESKSSSQSQILENTRLHSESYIFSPIQSNLLEMINLLYLNQVSLWVTWGQK